MTQMQSAGNAVNLVFLDACRNNPLARTSRSATRGLARLDAPRGSFVGYSTAPGDVAADGDGANSPYALALVQELKTPGISIEEAHRNVRAKVLTQSGNKQTPWDSSSLTGPVVLAAKVAAPAPQPVVQPAPEPQVQQQASVDKEALFWDSIKDSKDPDEFQAYLQQYPQGSFAPLAKTKLAKLSKSEATPAEAPSPPSQQGSATQSEGSGTFAVSSDSKAKIDQYLDKAAGAPTGWVLAIRTDGTAAAYVNCGGGGASAGCQHLSNPVIAARKAAMHKCGGAGKCIILYEGTKKVVSGEIVVQ
jgi:uncharacterized caspase-like protein